jgi:hypothetical protein
MTAGDLYGFAALFLIALAAVLMLLRSRLLKLTSIAVVRTTHLLVSTLAGLFLALHISAQFLPPISTGIVLGYGAVMTSVAAWLTGTAFLEKMKGSLFFHGVLSSVLIPLSMIHAATSGANFPLYWSQFVLAASATVVFANAAFHIRRALSSLPRSH